MNARRAGLERRLAAIRHIARGHTREDYEKRLAFELDVIVRMKFPGYFLIVADFIKWAKAQGIPVGPGRGSGAGSLVAWSLTITDLDPMRFGLLFERFLNPERVSMPDFDIDFCQERRDEVIAYVRRPLRRRPGRADHHLRLVPRPRRAAQRRPRAQMPLGQVDRLAKLVPQEPGQPRHAEAGGGDEPQAAGGARPRAVGALLAIASSSRASTATPRPTPPAS